MAGLVLRELGRMPLAGDVVEVLAPRRVDDAMVEDRAKLTVDRLDGLRIDRLTLRVLPGPSDGDA